MSKTLFIWLSVLFIYSSYAYSESASKAETIDFIKHKIHRYFDGVYHISRGEYCLEKKRELLHFDIDKEGILRIKYLEKGRRSFFIANSGGKVSCNGVRWNQFALSDIDPKRIDPSDQKIYTFLPFYCVDNIECAKWNARNCYDDVECMRKYSKKDSKSIAAEFSNLSRSSHYKSIGIHGADHEEQAKRLSRAFRHLVRLHGGKGELF